MKFKNAVTAAALLGYSNCIRIHNDNEDKLLAAQKPEEQQVSQQDLYTYAQIVSSGETMSKIRKDIDSMNQKSSVINDDLATSVFQEKIDQLSTKVKLNTDGDLASYNADDKQPEVESAPPKLSDKAKQQLSQKEELAQAEQSMEESANTLAWSQAIVETQNTFAEEAGQKKVEGNPNKPKVDTTNMSYNEMFHIAAQEGYKSYEEMQQEDLEKMDDDQQSQVLSEKIKMTLELETLDKDGNDTPEENSDNQPDSLVGTDDASAIDYANIATEDSINFAQNQMPAKQLPKKRKALAQKTEPKEKSFYEQILDKTVADTGKGAIKILAQPLKSPKKQLAKQIEESIPDDKSLLEQLWEKEHPNEVKKVEQEVQNKKNKLSKDVIKQQENGFASITSSINLLGLQ